jgi:uncharacterized membrane protein YphA (DoxX/SURF4 family)
MSRTSSFLMFLSRLVVGLLFVLSGLIKINDLTGFIYKLEEYFQVFEGDFGWQLAGYIPLLPTIAKVIALTEVVLGLCVLFGILRLLTTVLLILIMIFFTLLTGFSAISGAVQDCGCFGDVLHLTPWMSFGKDVVLLFLAFYLFVHKEYLTPLFRFKAANYVLVLVLAGASFGLMVWSYSNLPLVDLSAYAVGQNIEKNMTALSPEGQPLAKDYSSFAAACDSTESEFKGKVLLILSYDLSKADTTQLRTAFSLGNVLEGTEIRVILGTSSTSAVRDSVRKIYQPSFCVAPGDLTVLKTMIRSNPGYMLLKEGTIVGKWPASNAPSVAALQAKLQ